MTRRHRGSYNHRISRVGEDSYIISWTVDYQVVGNRLISPRTDWRNADRKGAERFSRKHGVSMPELANE